MYGLNVKNSLSTSNKKMVSVNSLPGYEDCEGYFVDSDGNVYSSKMRNVKSTEKLELKLSIRAEVRDGCHIELLAKKYNLAAAEILKIISEKESLKRRSPSRNLKNGYLYLTMNTKSGKVRACSIHRLVALAFLPKKSKTHLVVRHLDGNRHNNRVENLSWGTRSENVHDQKIHAGTGSIDYLTSIEQMRFHRDISYSTSLAERRAERKLRAAKELLENGALPVYGFQDYFLVEETNGCGIVSIKSGYPRVLSSHFSNKYGHLAVDLYKNGKKYSRPFHVIVMQTLKGMPPKNSPFVLHIDGNPMNNDISNLKYGDSYENSQDAIKHARLKDPNSTRLLPSDVRRIFDLAANSEMNMTEIAAFLKIDRTMVSLVLRRKTHMKLAIPNKILEKAKHKLKKSPRRTPKGIADTIRREFLAKEVTCKKLAKKYGINMMTVNRILHSPDHVDVLTTKKLQNKIELRLKTNVGSYLRKLSSQQVRKIRELHKTGMWNYSELGRKFGVHRVRIRQIVNQETYK